ncbi:hypothetical protein GALL_424830 [mine drainage metagenome]|uniref:Uncharacterized protein n=1 Tax=mine drainage metagenome TaxID=410659 RepID=A0A1J5Q764_9ZZZZ
MQTTGDRVAAAAELSTGVQDGEYDFHRWPFLDWVHRDWDSTAVVDNPDSAIFHDGYVDEIAVTGESLIDRVVDYLIDQVVQTPFTGRPDIHTGAFADRVEPFKNLDVAGFIGTSLLLRSHEKFPSFIHPKTPEEASRAVNDVLALILEVKAG